MVKRRRPRRRLNKRFVFLVILLVCMIAILIGCLIQPEPTDPSGETTTTPPTTTETPVLSGWLEENGKHYYQFPDGSRAVSWLDIGNDRYYFNADNTMHTGWLELDGNSYYLNDDGTMARGEISIDGVNYHFTSSGVRILVANPWNSIPEDYAPDLVTLDISVSVQNSQVDRSCYEDLMAMISDCNKECPQICVVSSYRTHEQQTTSYNRKVQYYLDQGYTKENARKTAGTIIAVPGTSEHQLGLAVDIVDTRLWALEEEQANLPAQKWLMENSWKYGFVLRYPKDKTDVTGIIYEPWHYRYVGKAVAQELHDANLTLEEYLDSLH